MSDPVHMQAVMIIDSHCLKCKKMIIVTLLPVHITLPLAYSRYNLKELRNDTTVFFWTCRIKFEYINYCIYF